MYARQGRQKPVGRRKTKRERTVCNGSVRGSRSDDRPQLQAMPAPLQLHPTFSIMASMHDPRVMMYGSGSRSTTTSVSMNTSATPGVGGSQGRQAVGRGPMGHLPTVHARCGLQKGRTLQVHLATLCMRRVRRRSSQPASVQVKTAVAFVLQASLLHHSPTSRPVLSAFRMYLTLGNLCDEPDDK